MKSDRIELLPLTAKDFEVFKAINTNPHVRKFLWDDRVMPDNVFHQVLSDVEKHFRDDRWGLWLIRLNKSNEVIGYAGLWKFFEEEQPQLLYALLPKFTGYGYAHEASKFVIDHAFNVLKFDELTASMDYDNVASRRVCERLAFRLVEERRIENKPIVFYKQMKT